MSKVDKIIIAGGSLAGATAAVALRDNHFHGSITVISAEDEMPYERRPLSKKYLRSQAGRAALHLYHRSLYRDHNITLLRGQHLTRVFADQSQVELDWSEQLEYDRLLLATGARPRLLNDHGSENMAGLYYLRTVADCDQIKEELSRSSQVVVVGAGLLGCEVAASLRQLGLSVYLLDHNRTVMERSFGAEVGRHFAEQHERNGVGLLMEDRVREIVGRERVSGIITASGNEIDCDLVIGAIGVDPADEIARSAGINCDDGILTKANLETSDSKIFACGDVARVFNPRYGRSLRCRHWFEARNQGRLAALTMLGGREQYDQVPYFSSQQYDSNIEYSGLCHSFDSVAIFGSPEANHFSAFWLSNNIIQAVMTVNIDNHMRLRDEIGQSLSTTEVARHRRATF